MADAAAYDAWYSTPLGAAANRIELDLVAELARPTRGERALDVGCGTGVYAAWLADVSLDVVGLDLDPDMLEAARAKAPGARFAPRSPGRRFRRRSRRAAVAAWLILPRWIGLHRPAPPIGAPCRQPPAASAGTLTTTLVPPSPDAISHVP